MRIVPGHAALVLPLILASCGPPPRPEVNRLKDLAPGQVIVVGKVKLTPPLEEGEQTLGYTMGSLRDKAFMLADERWRELQLPGRHEDYAGRIEAPLGQTFFVASSCKPFCILGGKLFLTATSDGRSETICLPGGFWIGVRPDEKAIYIGTIHYRRNEFWKVTVAVEDEFEEARGLFEKKFGPGLPLRKALVEQKTQ